MKKLLKTLAIALLPLSILISCGTTNVVDNSYTPTGDYLTDSINYTLSVTNPNNKAYYEEGAGYIYDHNLESAAPLITKWEKESPLDPDLSAIKFNTKYEESVSTTILQSLEVPKDKAYLTMEGKNGETIYIYEEVSLDEQGLQDAIDILEKTTIYHPVRLDIWFGLVRTYLDAGQWRMAEDAFNRCLEVLDKTDNQWLWTNNATISNVNGDRTQNDMDFILACHDYLAFLYSVRTEETISIAKNMTASLFERFPNNVVLLNLVAADNMNMGNFDEGKALFLQAYELDPTDLVVIGNLAFVSCLEKNEADFNKYYYIMINSGNEMSIEQATELKEKYFK